MNLSPWRSKDTAKTPTSPGLIPANENSNNDLSVSKRPTLAKSKSQPKVAGTKSMSTLFSSEFSVSDISIANPRKRVPVVPIMDLSPIKASPLFDASAKENISSFNRLASVAISVNKKKNAIDNENRDQTKVNFKASPNNNTNASARRPLGPLNTRNNIPRHVSLVKKPSGNSNGGKAFKVLGESQNVNKERTKGKESTNAKDRVKEWEREKERLREMAQLEEMQRERDDLYEKKKKERVEEKSKKVRIVDSEEKEKENSEEKEKEEGKKTENELEKEIDKERDSAEKDFSPPALQIVDSANDCEWDKDFSATSPVSPMFRSNPLLTQGLYFISCCHGYESLT